MRRSPVTPTALPCPNGSEKIADAHVVAVCAAADAALVITGDPDDINDLAPAVRECRNVTRDPVSPLLP